MSIVIGGIVFFVLLACFILLGPRFRPGGRRSRAALLASLSGRWEGRVHEGGIFSGDRLEILVDGIAVEVTFADEIEEHPGWTHLHFDWRSEHRLTVAPQDELVSQVRRLWGGADLEFDDPRFDNLFRVESSDPAWARSVLDLAVRRSLLELHRTAYCHGPGLTLYVGHAGIVLRVMHVLVDNPLALGSFIELGVDVLQRALGRIDSAGVDLEPVRTPAGSACPVCGHIVADDFMPCPTCRTPHHRECWKYLGGCAIFACRGKVKSRAG